MRPTLLLLCALPAFAGTPYLTEPALCPTRPEVAFVSGGDIWVAPSKGGEARLLVSHPAEETRPLYSPDGAKLAFVSTRTGGGDIYILTLASGELKRLTFDDALDQLDAWSRDGRWIWFSNTMQDVGRKNDIYRVSVEGGTPLAVSADRFTNEFQAAPSPDGSTLAFAARGVADAQWWRNGHSHLDESEIWLRRENGTYERLVERTGKNTWPMWMPDGKQLYFMSDRSGAQNIWTTTPGARPRQVTKFTTGRVVWPSIAYDGKAVVFERDFKIWQLDTKNGEAYALPIALVGSSTSPEVAHLTLTQFNDLDVSPDGRKIVVVAHGEIFAAAAREGGEAVRVTRTPAPESQVSWAPDSTKIAYLGLRDAVQQVFLYDFAKRQETQLTTGAAPNQGPRFSPDGKSLAFIQGRKELVVYDLEAKQARKVASGYLGGGFGRSALAWSPDSKWLAYSASEDRALRNIYVVPVAGGEARPVTFLANTNIGTVVWSPDGKFLLYDTGQRTETPQIARVDLVPRQPKFAEDRFDELFKAEPPRAGGRGPAPEPKPAVKVEIDFDDIRQRISMLPIGLPVGNPQISPDGKWLLFNAAAGTQQNLYVYSLDDTRGGGRGGGGRGGAGGARAPRQLTTAPGAKTHAQFTADSREVFYLEGGRVMSVPVESAQPQQPRATAVTAEMDVDFHKEKMAVFEQAWSAKRDSFYDPKYHGADWEAVRKTYAPLIEASRTPDEMRRILRLMVGELNASHLGVSAPQGGGGRGVVGQVGLSFDRAEYEANGKLKITAVLPHSPAALAKIQPGEELRSVDGVAIGPRVNLDELLQHKTEKRVTLDVSGRQVVVQPVPTLADPIYRKWVEDNRAYVAKASNGRLGYVHIRDMGEQSLTQLYLDLDSQNRAREGVVVDIRNNNGGFVNAYALDVISRRPYMSMTYRDSPTGSARTVLGQRSLELPTILVVNQHSLSDAEDFTEGYRTLKLGKVVGEPTAGWIIYTGTAELVDGSTMRLPATLIQGADGKNMERNPRPVDVPVTRPIGESLTGRDSQLDAAVKELLAQLGK
jgi:Tol biopolymer transport system component